ncbi:hypothetical protein HO665_04675 [Streptococcus suis]|nr:hypothetical protein [Streptococcus suis]NQH95840.1 hypothetical protein [Streptococcus suis]NQO46367.1 hypothetical protein [Streptococcus suis]WNF84420.1 hypothetical protein RJW52_00390 [Streptococcus suis]HEL1613160.1 hypothetical protein [Streptococcus suis]
MKEEYIRKLLYDIPEGADYAIDASELEKADISSTRVRQLEELLQQGEYLFEVSMLLTAWGYDSGFNCLTELFDKGLLRGFIVNRLYGYDETYKHILDNLILFWINKGAGEEEEIEVKVNLYIKKIIQDTFLEMYDLDPLITFLQLSNTRQELIELIKQNLEKITLEQENFLWRIKSDLKIINLYDKDFVDNFINKYSLDRDDVL